MQIQVNGEVMDVVDNLTASGLVDVMNLEGKRFAMERNGAVVPRSRLAETILASNDRIEIVQAIGGG